MQEWLIIRLPASHKTGPVVWVMLVESTHEVIASGEIEQLSELSQLSQRAQRCRVTIALPGQDVTIEQVTLPGGARRHLNKVVPFALEEDVADDIDSLHFSWPAANRGLTPLPVVIASKQQMHEWQLQLQQAMIEADEWLPDYLLLPYAENEWHCLQLGDDIIVRSAQWEGFALEAELLNQVLQLKSEDQSLARIVHYGDIALSQPPAPLHPADIEVPITALAEGEGGFDIRQHQFKPTRKQETATFNWRPIAVAAACCFIIAVTYNITRAVSLNQQVEALAQQSVTLYQQQFPDERRLVNLRVQLQRKLDALGVQGSERTSLLGLLDRMTAAFAAAPSMTVELLKYQRGELRLQALAGSFGEFETFQQNVERTGLRVEQGTLNSRGQQVAGTLTIAVAAASGGES